MCAASDSEGRGSTCGPASARGSLVDVGGRGLVGNERLVERQHGAQLGGGAIAELGGHGEQIVGLGRRAALAALDVDADEVGQQPVKLGQPLALRRVGP